MARRRTIIGVMGGAAAGAEVSRMAEELGQRIARAGWVLLSGGRPAGVMLAASRGASEAGGLVIGVLPGADPDGANDYVDIAIATGLADARNLVNVLSSDVVVACPGGAGTLSEVALAAKNGKPLVLLGLDPGPAVPEGPRVLRASDPAEAVERIRALLGR
ncbi:MAG: TIGR00725 family protein [Deltaproteobacteria bacterium]|nr:TIGR00725 family protein [Deltaproteobacteria bacterium]